MKKVAILLGNGFEIMEAMVPVDILKRGGLEVVTVSISEKREVISSNKIPLISDNLISEMNWDDYDLLILPGGYPGYVNLKESVEVQKIVNFFVQNEKYIGAICGAPAALKESGILEKTLFTCHSSLKNLVDHPNFRKEKIVRSHNLVTSPGAGFSLEFGFQLAELFLSENKIKEIKKGMELF